MSGAVTSMPMRVLSKPNRALLGELVRTDFKLRYQGSVLGYLWSLLRPLVLFAILYEVFARFLKLGGTVPHYPVYLLLGIVIWSFFGEVTNQGLVSIVARADLIRKIRLPRWIIVVSASLSGLINLFLNMCVVVVFMALERVGPMATLAWMPLVLLEVYVFALGISLLLAALYVRFRDISYIWELLLQGAFYVTPIIYPVTRLTNHTFRNAVMLSPMSQAIQDARHVAVTHKAATLYGVTGGAWYDVVPFAVVIVVLLVGVAFFRRESPYFAENI